MKCDRKMHSLEVRTVRRAPRDSLAPPTAECNGDAKEVPQFRVERLAREPAMTGRQRRSCGWFMGAMPMGSSLSITQSLGQHVSGSRVAQQRLPIVTETVFLHAGPVHLRHHAVHMHAVVGRPRSSPQWLTRTSLDMQPDTSFNGSAVTNLGVSVRPSTAPMACS